MNWFAPGAALPPGWVRTGFREGFATNPRCYPPRGGALLDISAGGDFRGARRNAALAREDPDLVARNIGQLTRAVEEGRLRADVGARLVSGLLSPPLAAAQADQRVRALTDEDVEARKRMKEAAILPEGALSLAQVRNQCNPRIGQWACFTRWPGGWLPFDNPIVRAHPDVWKGPTEYAKFLPECFGFIGAPWQLIGHYVTDLFRRALLRPTPQPIARRRLAVRGLGPPGAIPGAPGVAVFEVPAAGTVVYAGHPSGPWGNPGIFIGPYVAGMESFWRSRNGGVFLTQAELDAQGFVR